MDSENAKKNLEVTIDFLGAVGGTVTGSGYLVRVRRGNIVKKILVDYGIFQGEDESLNVEREIGSEIDFVLLTHAHLDHCGGIPMLYKNNNRISYTGNVYGSTETLNQASHILRDAAKLNLFRSKQKIDSNCGVDNAVNPENADIVDPSILYLPEDVEEAVLHFKSVPMEKEITICEGIDVKFIPNSHINGSTMIEIYASYGAERYGVAFSGDVGKRDTPLYRKMSYEREPNINTLVLESLHGTQEPEETYIDSIRTLKKIVKKCIREHKNLYIPVFALDRSAIFLMIVNQFMDYGIKFNCFFDSPLAEKELQCYMRAYFSGESRWFDYDKKDPFNLERIEIIDSYENHMQLVKKDGPNVVLTSSCMGYGGRVLDYLDQHIQDDNAVFVFPGFLPETCPSKILLDAEKGKMVEVNDKRYIKHCETYHLNGFSSHGYLTDKLEIIARYCNADTIFLTHGDEQSLEDLQTYLRENISASIIVPDFYEYFILK